jgi:putative sigma-54 modulation protein
MDKNGVRMINSYLFAAIGLLTRDWRFHHKIMTTRARIRPSRKKKSVIPSRGRPGALGRKKQDVSADQSPKAAGQKTARKPETLVPAHIRALGIYLNQDARTSIQRKLDTKFRKFARSIERMSMRLKDANGPRGGVDHICRIKVVLRNLPSVVYEKQDASLEVAIGAALSGAERAVRRTLQRIRSVPFRKRQPSIA